MNELGRSTTIRNKFESKYAGVLADFNAISQPRPVDCSATEFDQWELSNQRVNELKALDPRTWQICYRLANPIDQRLIELRNSQELMRKSYGKGERRRMAAMYDSFIDGEYYDHLYRVMDADMDPKAGGFRLIGDTWVEIPPADDYVYNPPDIEVTNPDVIQDLEIKKQEYLQPLTAAQRYRLDHELG